MGNEQIELAVVIVIEPDCSGREPRIPNTSLCGDIGESSVSQVSEEVVPVERGDIDVVMAVVIVVTNGATEAVDLSCESRFFGDVGKCAVVVIVIEGWIGMSRPMAGPVPGVNEENVLPSIAVVIYGAHTAAHGFWQILLAEGARVMVKMNP